MTLTIDDIRTALPPAMKSSASQQLADYVNNIAGDPDVAEHVRKNFTSYTSVLQDGKFTAEEYVNAVTYVSYKIMGLTNKDSFIKTFPHRYQALSARAASDKEISSHVSAYNKTKLVNLILEQSLVPTWVLNQSVYQDAINVQAHLMRTANSEKVRAEAANSILTHLKRPETKQVELNIGVQETDGMKELKDTLGQLAQQQQDLIAQGVTTQKIAHQPLVQRQTIDSTAIDVTPDPATKTL